MDDCRAIPSLPAMIIKSASDDACILRIRLVRWTLTVTSLVPISNAICLFRRPATTNARILCSRGQRSEALPERSEQLLILPVGAISLEGGLDRVQQVLLAKGLGQEFDRAGLHCPHRHRDVAVAGQEDDRQI